MVPVRLTLREVMLYSERDEVLYGLYDGFYFYVGVFARVKLILREVDFVKDSSGVSPSRKL